VQLTHCDYDEHVAVIVRRCRVRVPIEPATSTSATVRSHVYVSVMDMCCSLVAQRQKADGDWGLQHQGPLPGRRKEHLGPLGIVKERHPQVETRGHEVS